MWFVLFAKKAVGQQTNWDFGAVRNVGPQKMNELIIAGVLIAVVLIAVLVSWISGKSSGKNEQMLQDTLDHQEKLMKAEMAQRQLNKELQVVARQIRARKDEPLTQDNVDKMLKKYKDLN